ncbi:MAG: IclR family transcriptional regulator [Acidobacteriia bacterium]|nr:IclR family transcriptional regulator [Terriglobia bacterium]MBV8903471.1 IclR family transcriptional regulator [Terriglobia bacterium]
MNEATNSLERALAVLETIAQVPGGLRNAEIHRRMRIPKSTCTYILSRLEQKGYLTKNDATGRYRVGLTPVALAHNALREIGVRTIAEPALYKLATATGLSAGIGILERGYVLIIDRVEGNDFVRDVVESAEAIAPARHRPTRHYPVREDRAIGRELPAHTTAVGKVLMAWLPEPALLKLLEQRGLPRRTRKTITSKARLVQELESVRELGYAIADGEYSSGLRSIATPIRNAAGFVSAGVSLNGPITDVAWDDPAELVELVKSAAREISRRAQFLREAPSAID